MDEQRDRGLCNRTKGAAREDVASQLGLPSELAEGPECATWESVRGQAVSWELQKWFCVYSTHNGCINYCPKQTSVEQPFICSRRV